MSKYGMSSGFQENQDSLGLIKSSDIPKTTNSDTSVMGIIGKGVQSFAKTMNDQPNTFVKQPTLNYQMVSDAPQTIGGVPREQAIGVIKQYANSLNTRMKYPSYGSK